MKPPSKPLGPIPPGFAAIDGVLAIGGVPVTTLVERTGDTPLFVYDMALISARVQALRDALPSGLAIHYAVKANPFAPLLSAMSELVDGFDIASGGELRLIRDAGIDPERVSFAGPGKRDDELSGAIAAGVTINLESEDEASRALRIADALGIRPQLAIRVNPDFDLKGSGMKMGGGARPFGIDAERVPALMRRLDAADAMFAGLHIYAGSQALDAEAVADAQAALPRRAGSRSRTATSAVGSAFPISPGTARSTPGGSARGWVSALPHCRRRCATPASRSSSAAIWSAKPAST